MPFLFQLTDDAALDLEEICDYTERNDSPARAEHVLERIERAFEGLTEHPERGAWPRQPLEVGVREYRGVFFKPCRIICRVAGSDVRALVIADGRRGMRALVERRLLQA